LSSRTGLALVMKNRSSPKASASTSRNLAGRLVRPLASMVDSKIPRNMVTQALFATLYHYLPLCGQNIPAVNLLVKAKYPFTREFFRLFFNELKQIPRKMKEWLKVYKKAPDYPTVF
jgi:hypothetical protein